MPDHPLLDYLTPHLGAMLESLEALVVRESPSYDKPALDALAGDIAARFANLGLHVDRLANELGGDHVRVRLEGQDAHAPAALVLGHFDTVWPSGTLAKMPFRVEDGRAHGPGVFDMKAS